MVHGVYVCSFKKKGKSSTLLVATLLSWLFFVLKKGEILHHSTMSAFQRRAPTGQPALPQGTRLSVYNTQLLTSTGVSSLDDILYYAS
jgi:hypothetical protein